ncbi:MAG: metallophosphoesterase [Clostridiales bacterium]|nr:metallophosphoesterase [Clostridiales bacterium]
MVSYGNGIICHKQNISAAECRDKGVSYVPVIKWIHFSDLHLNSDGMETELLRDELPDFLLKSGIRCDYAFCTGDIRYAPDGAYPNDTAEYILSLCTAAHVPVENLFIVPGNHEKSGRTYEEILAFLRGDEGETS